MRSTRRASIASQNRGIAEDLHFVRRSAHIAGTRPTHPSFVRGCAFSALRAPSAIFSARSSIAEQPTDNRPTLAQSQAGGPILGGLTLEARGRGANACGGQWPLRGGTSTLFAELPASVHPLNSPLTHVRDYAISALPRSVRQPSLLRSYVSASHCSTVRERSGATGPPEVEPLGRARRARANRAPAAIRLRS